MSENKDTPRITVTNYTRIWNLDMVIYAMEGRKLPYPVNFRILGIFAVVEILMYILHKTVLFFVNPIWTYVLIPGGLTWVIAKQKLDGKAPHKWIWGMILFYFRPRHISRYKKMVHHQHYQYGTKIIYRTQRERG